MVKVMTWKGRSGQASGRHFGGELTTAARSEVNDVWVRVDG